MFLTIYAVLDEWVKESGIATNDTCGFGDATFDDSLRQTRFVAACFWRSECFQVSEGEFRFLNCEFPIYTQSVKCMHLPNSSHGQQPEEP